MSTHAHPDNILSVIKFWADISYRMLRIRTVLVMVTFQAIGYEAVKPTGAVSVTFILGAIMLGALYMSATCFNDVSDEEVDKVNLANDVSRPLMTTNVTSQQLKWLGIITLIISLVTAIAISPAHLVLAISGILLSVFYSLPPIKISHRGIFASLWLPLSYVILPFLTGSFIQGDLTRTSMWVLLTMYVTFIGRILLKDFRDYEGDKKFGKLNFLVRHGPVKTCIASASAWILGDVLFCVMLARKYPAVAIIMQPIIAGVLYGLYRLAYEKKRPLLLLEVLFIGRLGNAIAVSLLTALTLKAYHYPALQNNLIIIAVGGFIAVSAVGLWHDSALKTELEVSVT
jgi:4-hydroxybenzoate polyprenyltransferase